MEVLIEGIPVQTLLEVYYKDLERKERNREANRRYKKTEKGRLTNKKLVKQHRERKKAAAVAAA